MIIDIPRFVATERASWSELEKKLGRLEADPQARMSLVDLQRFHFLYQKASADLARLSTFAFEPEICRYLESLVARAYGEIHETREGSERVNPVRFFWFDFPAAFQRHIAAFALASAIFFGAAILGGALVKIDPEAKAALLGPFSHLQGDPAKRVAREEHAKKASVAGYQSEFSAMLMTHNIRVSIFTLASGITAGVLTTLLLFYNGIILGAISLDYVSAGQTQFLLGWLLPHGVIEIPALLISGQAGLLLGGAIIGWKNPAPLPDRLRALAPDLVLLVVGFALLLIWAGIIEAFLSQWHAPFIPYSLKITFGLIEFVLLIFYLGRPAKKNAARTS